MSMEKTTRTLGKECRTGLLGPVCAKATGSPTNVGGLDAMNPWKSLGGTSNPPDMGDPSREDQHIHTLSSKILHDRHLDSPMW